MRNYFYILIDKIVEIAPRWFATVCDNDDQDWNHEDEDGQQQADRGDMSAIASEAHPTSSDDSFFSQHIRSSATGEPINAANSEIASNMTSSATYSLATTKSRLGTFSRLLISAMKQLAKKNELRRTKITGIYMTKLELRTASATPFLIRKIYITPSTIFYEGPYHEEKCAVTRQFEDYQDRFLRVTFRDESKAK